jgi:hypothetical protein
MSQDPSTLVNTKIADIADVHTAEMWYKLPLIHPHILTYIHTSYYIYYIQSYTTITLLYITLHYIALHTHIQTDGQTDRQTSIPYIAWRDRGIP